MNYALYISQSHKLASPRQVDSVDNFGGAREHPKEMSLTIDLPVMPTKPSSDANPEREPAQTSGDPQEFVSSGTSAWT